MFDMLKIKDSSASYSSARARHYFLPEDSTVACLPINAKEVQRDARVDNVRTASVTIASVHPDLIRHQVSGVTIWVVALASFAVHVCCEIDPAFHDLKGGI